MSYLGAIVKHTANQTSVVEDHYGWVYPTFGTEVYDNGNFHRPSYEDVLIAPSNGYYYCTARFELSTIPYCYWAGKFVGTHVDMYESSPKEYPTFTPNGCGPQTGGDYGMSLEWYGWMDTDDWIAPRACWISSDYPTHPNPAPYLWNAYFTIRKINQSRTKTLVKVKRTSTLTLANDVEQTLSWQSAEITNTNMWTAGTPTRITFPANGFYQITGNFKAASATGLIANTKFIRFKVRLDGTNTIAKISYTPYMYYLHLEDYFTAGQYIELLVYQIQSYQTEPMYLLAEDDKPSLCVRRIDEL